MRHLRIRRSLLALHGVSLLLASFSLLLWPGLELARALFDSHLGGPEPATQSWRWHRALTPRFEMWAAERRRNGAAARLSIEDISGTEWPLFGTVFYLRATENLDRAWRRRPQDERPALYARGAIDAAAGLLADPVQASWVQQHWGAEHYLGRENVFYRMLLIDGIATQMRLTGTSPHLQLLRQQTESLALELASSATGLLADYPGQTFPADVAAAWHAILRADAVLGTDHRDMAHAGLRGFMGELAPELDLPPYAWYGENRLVADDVRGCANAWLLHHAPFVWPEQARAWSAQHREYYWQEGRWLSGYREFRPGIEHGFYSDVDSGPVLANLGVSATAFGLGAARIVGDRGKARAIALQAIAASVPLPNGRLLVPLLLSDAGHAPLLGEAALLYNLTQPRAPGFEAASPAVSWREVPGIVWLILVVQWVLGAGGAWRGLHRLHDAMHGSTKSGIKGMKGTGGLNTPAWARREGGRSRAG